MKKLIALILLVVLIVVMVITAPEKRSHTDAMMEAVEALVDEEVENQGLEKNILAKAGKSLALPVMKAVLQSKVKMHNYYVFNTTYMKYKGKEQLLSVGVLGHVFTFDKEMLREALTEAATSGADAAD